MPSLLSKKPSRETRDLIHRLSLIETLVFGLPFVLLLYLYLRGRLELSGWNILFFAFILLIVLAGLIMIRQFFERVLDFSRTVRAAAAGQMEIMDRFRASGELAVAAGAFDEILGRMETANQELSRKVAGLSVMKEMLKVSGETRDLRTLLEALLEQSMILASAQIGSVFQVDPEEGRLSLVRYSSPFSEPMDDFPSGTESPVMTRVMDTGRAFRVQNIETDPRIQKPNDPKYGAPSFISLPVYAGKRLVGVVNLARKENLEPFDEEDEHLLALVAQEMGFALENAYLSEQCHLLKRELSSQKGETDKERAWRLKAETERSSLARRMAHAQKMEAIGTVAGGVAHDFNNLLMAIQGNVSILLLDASPGSQLHGRLRNIEKQVASGTRLTGQLLGFARKGNGPSGALDLNRLISDTAETFGRARKDIHLDCRLEEGMGPVEAEAAQLEQVLWNLLVNAGDAMPKGGTVRVTTRSLTSGEAAARLPDAQDRPYARLTIADTGEGMDQATLSRIFEPFFTTKEVGKGTGLGLASVYEIVKALNGHVEAHSEPGEGSAFEIFLPQAPDAPAAVETEAAPGVQASKGLALLVDDESTIRAVGSEMLAAVGYRVLDARDGAEGLRHLREHADEIVLVVLDRGLPDMDGARVLDAIREKRMDLPVLLTSGFDRDSSAEGIENQENLVFLQKPFSLEDLSRSLNKLFPEKG